MYKTLESVIKGNHVSTAGVVVSCKIPILAIRVRFPGSAQFFFHKVWHLSRPCTYLRNYVCTLAWMGAYVYACMCACVCKCGGPPILLPQVNKCSKSENKITSISVNVGRPLFSMSVCSLPILVANASSRRVANVVIEARLLTFTDDFCLEWVPLFFFYKLDLFCKCAIFSWLVMSYTLRTNTCWSKVNTRTHCG